MSWDGTFCIIDVTHTGANAAEAAGVNSGCWGGDSDIFMTGGELTCLYFNVGREDFDSYSNGYFKITGGVYTDASDVGIAVQLVRI